MKPVLTAYSLENILLFNFQKNPLINSFCFLVVIAFSGSILLHLSPCFQHCCHRALSPQSDSASHIAPELRARFTAIPFIAHWCTVFIARSTKQSFCKLRQCYTFFTQLAGKSLRAITDKSFPILLTVFPTCSSIKTWLLSATTVVTLGTSLGKIKLQFYLTGKGKLIDTDRIS